MPHGYGTYYYKNGDIYVGTFQHGFRDGTGKYTWSDGLEYEGEWLRNQMHGIGKLKNGSEYDGHFEYGKFSGKGYYKLKNSEYSG